MKYRTSYLMYSPTWFTYELAQYILLFSNPALVSRSSLFAIRRFVSRIACARLSQLYAQAFYIPRN